VTGTVGTDSHEIARSVGVFSQTSPLVKYFHSCLMSGEEYEEKEWDSLMELPPHSSKKSGGPPSQTKTQCAPPPPTSSHPPRIKARAILTAYPLSTDAISVPLRLLGFHLPPSANPSPTSRTYRTETPQVYTWLESYFLHEHLNQIYHKKKSSDETFLESFFPSSTCPPPSPLAPRRPWCVAGYKASVPLPEGNLFHEQNMRGHCGQAKTSSPPWA